LKILRTMLRGVWNLGMEREGRALERVVVAWAQVLHPSRTVLEATQEQMDGFFCQLPYECHLEEMVSVGD